MEKSQTGEPLRATARRTFVAALVAGAVVVGALALWKIKLLVSLLFLAFVVTAAMRPGVEALHRRGVPRAVGIILHYLGLLLVVGLLLWLAVPRALDQVNAALGGVPTSAKDLEPAIRQSGGIKHDLLVALQRRLRSVPSGASLLHPAIVAGKTAIEIGVGIFFLLASAAYWIYERDRAIAVVTSLVPPEKRGTVRKTWNLVDLKLGAYLRGQGILVLAVGTVLSLAFWAIGVPYWILVGAFAGIVELVPVIGPLLAGAVAVAAGLTVSWHVALFAALAVLVVRLLEDYVVIPRVLGEAVGLSPLIVLVTVASVTILLGGLAVLVAIPLAATIATIVDVIVFHKDPAEEEVPTVIFPAKEGETV